MTVKNKTLANAIRFLSADAIQRANSGHPGMPMGMADVATVLYQQFLKFNPNDPTWADRDRFVLSAGHGSMLLYALLHLTGYKAMSMQELKNFRQWGSKTAGHPEYGHAPGIETTTGPLGQGLATAVGMALAERMQAARYGDDLVNHYTYVIVGDGCLMEGLSHEAISLAGHLGLSKLIILWDDNAITIDGPTDVAVSDDQLGRFRASNWYVDTVDGHDHEALALVIEKARQQDKPAFIACKTTIGFGAPNKGGTAATHGSPLGEDELALTRKALHWPHEPFVLPDDIVEAWRNIGSQGEHAYKSWTQRLEVSPRASQFKRSQAGELPEGWKTALEAHKRALVAKPSSVATRKASGAVLEVLTAAVPELIGGSADLTGSVNTRTTHTSPITATDMSGRYIHYGVREHAMAAAMNGMALHGGFIPYSGTFLVFADYMRGAMRLSALMKQRVIYVLTHDSIGLGEDGPTHQPVETLASLRAMPNFNLYRPADAVETAECWALALESAHTPSGMALTRQALPALREQHTDENLCARGAYVLEGSSEAAVRLLATGSEVSIAVAARALLEAEGIRTAVVSMPCWALFNAQESAYQTQVLGTDCVRIGIEAAMSFGWHRYIGERGSFVGMPGFGASAPAPELFQQFSITPDEVVARAKEHLNGEAFSMLPSTSP